MTRIKWLNRMAWIGLAALSFVVGTWVLLAEGLVYSKFYVFFLFTLIIVLVIFIKRKSSSQKAKPKKRQ